MRPPTLAIATATALLLSSATAFAGDDPAGPVGPDQPAVAAAPPAAVPPPIDPGQLADPNIDRALLFPTAQTQPAGSVVLTSYEVIVLGATVGITNRLQLSAVALLPELGEWGPERAWAATLKWQVLRKSLFRLSVMGGLGYEEDGLPDEQRPADHSDPRKRTYNGLGGVVGSLCASEDCHSLLSLNAHLRGLIGDDGWRRTEALLSASFVGRLGQRWKVVVEYGRAAKLDPVPSLRRPALAIGVRAHRNSLAAELGSVMIVEDEGMWGLPYFSLGVRF
jgi:hypothetical protein